MWVSSGIWSSSSQMAIFQKVHGGYFRFYVKLPFGIWYFIWLTPTSWNCHYCEILVFFGIFREIIIKSQIKIPLRITLHKFIAWILKWKWKEKLCGMSWDFTLINSMSGSVRYCMILKYCNFVTILQTKNCVILWPENTPWKHPTLREK